MRLILNWTKMAAASVIILFAAAGQIQADFITFGEEDLDRLDLEGTQVEGDFMYAATVGDGWELETLFAVEGAALVTFFNGEGSLAGDTVEFSRTDSQNFTFDSVDFSTISTGNSDAVIFSGFLDGDLVDTLSLDFSNEGSFVTVDSDFSGPIDLLTLEVTFAGSNAAIFDNLVLGSAIPEPGLSLVGLCVGLVASLQRRRNKTRIRPY